MVGSDKEKATAKVDDDMKEKGRKMRAFERRPRNKEFDGKQQSPIALEKKRGASDMDVDTEEVNKRARRGGEEGDVKSDVLNAGLHG